MIQSVSRVLGLCLGVLSGLSGTVLAGPASWNQFRGPEGTGVAEWSAAPVQLTGRTPAWKAAVPKGHSSPVLWGNRIFLTGVEQDRLISVAYDATSGERLWESHAPATSLERVHAASSPAAPTPYADEERLFVYFGSYGLLCYDHEGRELWRKAIPAPKSLYGTASSPIAHGENLILVLDNDANLPDSDLSQSKVVALRKETGELVWETARPFVRSGWSTPVIWRHGGGEDLVVLGSGRLCAFDPVSGAEKWFTTGFSRETIGMPVVVGELVCASAAMLGGVADEAPDPQPFWVAMLQFDRDEDGRIGRDEITEHFTFPLRPELPLGHPGFGVPLPSDPGKRGERQNGIFNSMDKDKSGFWEQEEFVQSMSFRRGKPLLMAVRPGGSGDVTETHVAWQLHRNIPEIPSPLSYDGRIYLVRNGGLLACVRASDGEELYRERLGASGQYGASPVMANGHLYLVSNRGVVSVVEAGDEFQLVDQRDLEEPVYVTPAFDASTIYLRGEANLWAFR